MTRPSAAHNHSGETLAHIDAALSTSGHAEHRTLDELAFYPPHGPRKSDVHYSIFESARRHLIEGLGVGCWIGGATKAAITEGLSHDHRCFGAKQLEAHHDLAEFAALTEIDWQKVAKDFPRLGIDSDEAFQRAAESEGGLLILCDRHHRSPRHGIHAISYPVWKLDRWARDDWEFTPDN